MTFNDDALDEAREIWAEIQRARETIRGKCEYLGLPLCPVCLGQTYTWKGTEDGNAYREACPACEGLGYGREP